MKYDKLRIMTNGKKFRIEGRFTKEVIYQVATKEVKKPNRFGPYRVVYVDETRTEFVWEAITDLQRIPSSHGLLIYSGYYAPIECNSKQKALDWIKNKWGEEGLKLVDNEDVWVKC